MTQLEYTERNQCRGRDCPLSWIDFIFLFGKCFYQLFLFSKKSYETSVPQHCSQRTAKVVEVTIDAPSLPNTRTVVISMNFLNTFSYVFFLYFYLDENHFILIIQYVISDTRTI